MTLRLLFLGFAALFASVLRCQLAEAQIVPSTPASMQSPSTSDVENPSARAASAENSSLPSAPPIHIASHTDSTVQGAVRRPFNTWLALSIVGQAAVLADVKTTLDLRRSNPLTFHESDPLARPFVNLPTPVYVGSTVAFTAALSLASWKLSTSENGWLRRHWWLPQAAQIVLNTQCAVHNAREK